MNTEFFLLKSDGVIAELIINRPEALNAANEQWIGELHSVLDELETTDGLRILVISGAGRSFCTGIDLNALARGEIRLEWFRRWEEALRRIEKLEAVTIAKLHGYVIGGGLQLALACDLRVATDNSKHGLPAVLEALIPGFGTWRLPKFIGLGRARRMVLTGELIEAPEAARIGLLDWVVPEGELAAMVAQITEQMLKGARTAQFWSKRLVTASFNTGFEDALEMYLDGQAQSLASPEHQRAMKEYLRARAERRRKKE
jgi:enoyl-CoA hydratase/carnithine racemase